MSATDILSILFQTPGPRGRAGLPAIFWGAPGVGKSSVIEAMAKSTVGGIETVLLSLRDPADVAGLPVPGEDGTGINLAPPAWARRLADAGSGVLFLDELSCAAPAVQAAALRVIAEGVVGELVMPPGVRVICAANPEEQAAGGWGLSAPMANRLLHLEWPEPDASQWAEWLVSDGAMVTSPAPKLSPKTWDSVWTLIRSGIAAYMRAKPQSLLHVPDEDATRGRAWASPRSWELGARALAGAKALGHGDGVQMSMLGAAVGDGQAAEAWEYLSKLDLPNPEDVLAGTASVPTDRGDRTYASLSAVIQTVMRDAEDSERRVIAFEVSARVARSHADIAAACIRPLAAGVAPLLRKYGTRISTAFAGPLKSVSDYLSPNASAPKTGAKARR